MPKRKDLKKILILGSGPIVIGQGCEFDYSGSQGCKALKEEGYELILINSNPATVMTDENMAKSTYIEPIEAEFIEKVIMKERPDAILPTLGGQVGLNQSLELEREGILKKYGIELLGVTVESIRRAEDRELFKEFIQGLGLEVSKGVVVEKIEEGIKKAEGIGYPVVIRSCFTLGGSGGSIAYNREEFKILLKKGLKRSPIQKVLIEESILGWKEYELEIMKDDRQNMMVVCSIENIDPMGIHTGDSITVAPQQTLSDREYQKMRDASLKIMKEIGVQNGGSNIQFAVDRSRERMMVIEMNPRVSRSSALASKVTGFPIAKVAARLAVGYHLDEIQNEITKKNKACGEPVLDYCVIKIPRWDFDKFPKSERKLGIQMKSIGEVMGIGRTFKSCLQKAIRSLDIGKGGFENSDLYQRVSRIKSYNKEKLRKQIIEKLKFGDSERLYYIKDALDMGLKVEEIARYTWIDEWFLNQMKELNEFEKSLGKGIGTYSRDLLIRAKREGYTDEQMGIHAGCGEDEVKVLRESWGIKPKYKLIDTCGGEFESYTPYYYSSYDEEDDEYPESRSKGKVMIIGSGANRIGQGIEFDYLCVKACYAIKGEGYAPVLINCNPETVSTDYDTASKLYFEPLTGEDILNVYEREEAMGVIVQFGGQTALNLVDYLDRYKVKILGTGKKSIHRTEDRNEFKKLLSDLGLNQVKSQIARDEGEIYEKAKLIEYPLIMRPSYTLGGKWMKIIHSEKEMNEYCELNKDRIWYPVIMDHFLEDAIEVDLEGVCDGDELEVCGILEHIEEAGVHSGDSSCVIPTYSLSGGVLEELSRQAGLIARELEVKGLMNIQFGIKEEELNVIEVNLRGSRTIPFLSKARGMDWTKVASQVILGKKLKDIEIFQNSGDKTAIKGVVIPYINFIEEDVHLGPEMKSTGEVMGIGKNFGEAFMKSQIAIGKRIPSEGNLFISVRDKDKRKIEGLVKELMGYGFEILATEGTRKSLMEVGIESLLVNKLNEGRPNLIDYIINGEVDLMVNIPGEEGEIENGQYIRSSAIEYELPLITTLRGFCAAVKGIQSFWKNEGKNEGFGVYALQDLHKG